SSNPPVMRSARKLLSSLASAYIPHRLNMLCPVVAARIVRSESRDGKFVCLPPDCGLRRLLTPNVKQSTPNGSKVANPVCAGRLAYEKGPNAMFEPVLDTLMSLAPLYPKRLLLSTPWRIFFSEEPVEYVFDFVVV